MSFPTAASPVLPLFMNIPASRTLFFVWGWLPLCPLPVDASSAPFLDAPYRSQICAAASRVTIARLIEPLVLNASTISSFSLSCFSTAQTILEAFSSHSLSALPTAAILYTLSTVLAPVYLFRLIYPCTSPPSLSWPSRLHLSYFPLQLKVPRFVFPFIPSPIAIPWWLYWNEPPGQPWLLGNGQAHFPWGRESSWCYSPTGFSCSLPPWTGLQPTAASSSKLWASTMPLRPTAPTSPRFTFAAATTPPTPLPKIRKVIYFA